jgi:lipoyl(octanoyl) transferase
MPHVQPGEESTRSAEPLRRLEILSLGTVPYATAARMQEARLTACLGGAPDALLVLEHPAVYTLGRGADPRHLGAATTGPVPVVRSERGGQVTFHGPGQLIGYPIVDLRHVGRDVRAYVTRLEGVLLRALAVWGIPGRREAGAPGVWVGDRKIGSIGIAIRRWVAWHGFALNVGTDLAGFDRITPCGIHGLRMTAVGLEGGPATVADAMPVVVEAFVEAFGYDAVHRLDCAGPVPAGVS